MIGIVINIVNSRIKKRPTVYIYFVTVLILQLTFYMYLMQVKYQLCFVFNTFYISVAFRRNEQPLSM